MKPEQFLTKEQMKQKLKDNIADAIDSLDLQVSKMSLIIQKALPAMSMVQLREILVKLQFLIRKINKTLED